MNDPTTAIQVDQKQSLRRRSFLSALVGVIFGTLTGCTPDPLDEDIDQKFSALEAKISELEGRLSAPFRFDPLAHMEGEFNERVVFDKSELTVNNPDGVLLNLVSTDGHVGIRFYKDFDFGNEQTSNPWHMGFIEGLDGYQGLAILRDWRFTAALWDEDGKLLLGHLDSHPPANPPAEARLHVRGTLNEVQTLIEGSDQQEMDIFQVRGTGSKRHLAVDSEGQIHVGSRQHPQGFVLHDTINGLTYSLKVKNGQLSLTRI